MRIALLPFLFLTAPGLAQDLIATSFQGLTYAIDSRTGVGQSIATNGVSCNAMARKGSDLWVSEQSGATANRQHHLGRLDEQTGAVTRVFSNIGQDLTGLATTGTFGLILGIVNDAPLDRLVQVHVNTGVVTNLGSTGFPQIQALTLMAGQFYGWDLNFGLLRIDHLTGQATDVNPTLGNGGADIQFLCAMSDGRLLGGRNSLYEIDPTTGVLTLIGGSGFSDLRGAEERFGWVANFGSACAAARGPANLTVTGIADPGNTLNSLSVNHATNAPGLLCIGLSKAHAGATPLPFDVDPLLGTAGCRVFQSSDITLFGTATLVGRLSFPLVLPLNLRGATFHVQHAALEPVPGGWSFSNATTVRTSL